MFLQTPQPVYVQAPRDALSMAADWALVVVGIATVCVAVGTLIVLFQTRRGLKKLGRAAEKKADPLIERSRSVAANLEFITATLRTDIEGLHRSVRALSDRLAQASDHMEDRIEEFNALLEVVQGEAEEVFLDTAATARGVRVGARELVRRGPSEAPLAPRGGAGQDAEPGPSVP